MSAPGNWNWTQKNHSSHSLYKCSEFIQWNLLLLRTATPATPIQINLLTLALWLSFIGLSLGYLDDDMTEDGQPHQPQAVEKLGGTNHLPCTCQHYHQPSWSNILDTCARAHPTLCQPKGLFYVSGRPMDRCHNCYAALVPGNPPPPPRPLPAPVQKAHTRTLTLALATAIPKPRQATPTPLSPCSCTSVYPSMPTQCYDPREVTVGHSKGKQLMTGSIKPTLFWGYRDPRCPKVRGPTCWEPDPYQPLLRLPPHQGPLPKTL